MLLSVMMMWTWVASQTLLALSIPSLLASATAMIWRPWRTISPRMRASSDSMTVIPCSGWAPVAPMEDLVEVEPLWMALKAVAPTMEKELGQRMVPPVRVTLAFGRLESSMPMLTALVTMWMPSRWRRLRATWAVVVPGGEGDGVAFDDHGCGGEGDASLLVGEALFAEGEGRVETERLVGELAGELTYAVVAMEEAALFELDEIAADAGWRWAY